MRLIYGLSFIFYSLLLGCGTALPESNSLMSAQHHQELQSGVNTGLTPQMHEEGASVVGSTGVPALRVKWGQIPVDLLAQQSLRVPDLSQVFHPREGFDFSSFQQDRTLQFESPLAYCFDSNRTHESYFAWQAGTGDQRIQSAEFQYERVGRDNRVYTGRSHRLVHFIPAQQVWYILFSKLFSQSEQQVWSQNQAESDLHKIKLRLNYLGRGWETIEVHFQVSQRGRER
jgi:hypothetical protein